MTPKFRCLRKCVLLSFLYCLMFFLSVNNLWAQEKMKYTFDHSIVSDQITKASDARRKGDLDSMLYYTRAAIHNIGDDTINSIAPTAYTLLGMVYRQQGKLDSCEFYYKRSALISKTIKDTIGLSKSYNNLGNVQHVQGNYEDALSFYIKSLKLKESLKQEKGIALSHHNIASIKLDMKDWEGAIDAFEKSQELALKVEYDALIQRNYFKLANCHREVKNYNKAIEFTQVALDRATKSGNKRNIASGYYELGETYTLKGQVELAAENYRKSLKLVREIKHIGYESAVLTSLGKLYVKNAENNSNGLRMFSPSEMESLLVRANELALQSESAEAQLQGLEALLLYYQVEKKYKNQAETQMSFMALKDSLYRKERSEAVVKQETIYKTAEQEKEIIQLAAENEIAEIKNKSLIRSLIGAISFFVILGIVGYQFVNQRNEKRRLQDAELFRSKLSSDLHDDVGTMLSSLTMQAEVLGLSANPQQADKMEKITILSREAMSRMRDTVWAIDSRKDNADSLLDRMKDYLSDSLDDHEKLQYNFTNSIDALQKIAPEVRQNIYLIFKEAVTNAYKYSNGNLIDIDLSMNHNILALRIKDNGVVDKATIKQSGTGLSNLKMRANRIGGELKLSFEDGCLVKLDVPLKK